MVPTVSSFTNPYLINNQDMRLDLFLEQNGFHFPFSGVMFILISEQLKIDTCNLKGSDLKKVDLDLLCKVGSPEFQSLVIKHKLELQNLINTLE